MLIFYTSIALAQIPAPQINLSGNIGCQGFPCVNNGTLIMASDANRTMTALETSAMYIKVTSSVSLTATRNLIAPAGRFNFTIENATTGGQSIQIIGASGTGITITNGTTVAVWNDGTNFVQVGSAGGGSGITALTGDVTASGTGSVAATVAGLKGVPFCTGFTPTTGQAVTYTTASSPNPCYTAATGGGGGTPGGSNHSVQFNSSSSFAGTAFTGIVKASTTADPAAAAFGDVVGLWSSCTGGYLKFDGTCSTPAGGVSTTGSPASGNLTKFSGASSITNGDLSGDTITSGTLVTTTVKVDGVAYPASPASTNLVPVVTTAGGSPATTYEKVPNAAIANPFTTVNGTTCNLGSPCTIASGSNIFGLWGFGTSIVNAAGSTNPPRLGEFSLLCGTTSAPCYNYGANGATAPQVTDTLFLQYAPSYQNPSAMLGEAGENDTTCGTVCNTAMQSQYYAMDAWVAIPPTYRQLASTAGGSTGTWFTDTTFAIYQPPLAASPGLPAASITSGSTKTFTIPSSASPVVGFTFGVENGFTGTFTLTIDGTLRTDSCSGTTTFSSAPCTPVVSAGGPYTYYREEYAVTSGIGHTVVVTTTNTGESVPVSVDWIPPSTEPTRGIVFHQSVLANFASNTTFNPIASAVVTQLHTDGLLVYYVDQTQYAGCAPNSTSATCPGINITTDISGTPTTLCAPTSLAGHPNDCGNLHGFQTIINTESSVGVNIGTINPVGSAIQNTGKLTSQIQIGNVPSGSQSYSTINGSPASTGILWYNQGSVFGSGMGTDTSTGLPFSSAFVNRDFTFGGWWSCHSNYNGSGLDVSSNFTQTWCANDTTGDSYQLGTANAAHLQDRSLISQPCTGTDSTGKLIAGTCGGSGLSGMTATQVPIAATATTITSSMPLAGAGSGITTGPVSGTTTNHFPSFTGTTGQLQDSGFATANFGILVNSQTWSGVNTFNGGVALSSFFTLGGSQNLTAIQGSTGTKLLAAGTVSGTAASLCTDANGNATTSGCPSGGSGTVTTSGTPTTGFFPLFTGSTVIGNSHLDDGITNASSITSSENIIAPVLIATTNTISPSYTIQTAGTATSGANFGSVGAYGMFGNYWTGTVSNTESATFSLVAGTGSNPAYTAQLAFTGSSGFAAFSAPALIASGLGSSTSPVCPNGTNNALTTVGCSGGGGAVSSVSNSDGSLTITPTTGAVVASLSATKNATLSSGSRSNNTIAYGESVVGGNQASLEAGNPLSTSFVGRIGFSSGGQVLNRGVSGAASNDIQKTQIYQNQSYQGVRYPLQIMMMGSNDYLSAFSPGSAQQLALFSTFHLNSMAYATIPSDSYVGDRTGNLNWNSAVSYVNGEVASSGGLNYIAVGGISGIPNLNKTPASNLNTYWVPYIPPTYFKIAAQASTTLTGTWNNDVTLVAGPTVNSVSPVLPALGSIASATGASLTVSLPNPAGDPLYLGYVKMDGNAGVASVTIDGSSPASGPTSLNAFGDSGAIIKTASQANTDGYALARWPIAATAPACTPTLSALTSNVATITCTNTFVVGQGVTFLNLTNVPFLNGTTETIASASGTSFTVAFTHANVTSAAEAVAARATPGHLVKISVTSTPTTVTITNIAITSNVVTGTCSATCGLTIGNSGYFSGVGTNTFLNGVRLTVASSSGSTFTASSTASGSTSGGWTHANVTSGADTGSFIVNWFSATWFGTYPAASTFQQFEGPNLAAMGVIPYNSQVTLSAQYNTQALADNALLQGDQAPITTIDVRNGYGNIAGLNLVTDYDAGSGPHPNDAGMLKLANMIEAQMQPPRTYNSNSTSYMQDSNPGSIGTISLSFGTYSFGTAGYSGTTPTTGVANISVKDVTASGRLFLTGLTVFTPTPTAATSYTSTSTENEIRLTNTAARAVIMPASASSGQTTVIKDSACTAATAPVTITVASGGTIDGFSSLVINQNCGSATINWISSGVYETKVAQALPGENVVAFSATPVFSPLFLMNTITLTGNVTSSTLAAGYPGQGMTMVVCNDATGSRTFVPPANVKGFGTIGATPSTCNSQHIVYSLSKTTWYADAAMVMNE